MPFQNTISTRQSLGQPGDFYDATPRRVTAYKLTGIDRSTPCIGRVFTLDASGNPQLGGTGPFAGILVNPMSLARQGLDATQAVNEGTGGELADMGRIIVNTTAAAVPGDRVQYDAGSGEITGAGTATPPAGMANIPGAAFAIFAATANGLAVVQL